MKIDLYGLSSPPQKRRESGGPGTAPRPSRPGFPLSRRAVRGIGRACDAAILCNYRGSPWPGLVRLGPAIHVFGAKIVALSRRGCPGTSPGKGLLKAKFGATRSPEPPFNFPRTAVRFRGNDDWGAATRGDTPLFTSRRTLRRYLTCVTSLAAVGLPIPRSLGERPHQVGRRPAGDARSGKVAVCRPDIRLDAPRQRQHMGIPG